MKDHFLKLWKELESSFGGKSITIQHKKPDLDQLLDQKEHTIQTNKGTVHILCHTEMFNNAIVPVIVFNTTSQDLANNYIRNKGFIPMQFLSHWIKNEYDRMMSA